MQIYQAVNQKEAFVYLNFNELDQYTKVATTYDAEAGVKNTGYA